MTERPLVDQLEAAALDESASSWVEGLRLLRESRTTLVLPVGTLRATTFGRRGCRRRPDLGGVGVRQCTGHQRSRRPCAEERAHPSSRSHDERRHSRLTRGALLVSDGEEQGRGPSCSDHAQAVLIERNESDQLIGRAGGGLMPLAGGSRRSHRRYALGSASAAAIPRSSVESDGR
jgi:hypothetical protein